MLKEALSDTADSLAVQGYVLKAGQTADGDIEVVIQAGPDACKECLTSRAVLEKIIASELQEKGVQYRRLVVTMPD